MSDTARKSTGIGLAVAIIFCCLIAGLGIAVSPPRLQAWILPLAAVLVIVLACIKSAAVSVVSFRCGKRFLGLLSALLAGLFLLLLMVELQRVEPLFR
jgi:hypothetical protein